MTHGPTLIPTVQMEPADVLPGPKRFCLTPITQALNTRWTFAVRYFNAKGHKVEDEYAADTRVEIENRLTTVVTRLRSTGMILCDCGCAFMDTTPETRPLTHHKGERS